MPSRRGSGYVLVRAGDTGLARWLAAAQPWEHGLAQTERGASFRGTVTVLGAVAPHRKSTSLGQNTRTRLLKRGYDPTIATSSLVFFPAIPDTQHWCG